MNPTLIQVALSLWLGNALTLGVYFLLKLLSGDPDYAGGITVIVAVPVYILAFITAAPGAQSIAEAWDKLCNCLGRRRNPEE